MMRRCRQLRSSASQALVVVLLAVTLLSVIMVAFIFSASLYQSISRQDFQKQSAQAIALIGLHSAVADIRTGLGPWDDPFDNFCGGASTSAPPTFFWTTSPGVISRWNYTSTTPQTNYPLFSQATYGDTNLANLNAPTADGLYPIIGGASPPQLQVYWADVLQNPLQAPSAANQVIGRFAFWVDDESAKININTADGTLKYQTNSLGLGSPSEVSLLALQSGGAGITTTLATNIVYVARSSGFNSTHEILRAATGGTNFDLYTNNVFNITTCSRSPELNIFGQPRMAILPMLEDSDVSSTYNYTNLLNGLTMQPLKEIYPVPSQLPPYGMSNMVYQTYWGTIPNAAVRWPLAFRAEMGYQDEGGTHWGLGASAFRNSITEGDSCWDNGMLLAHYLAGTNSLNQQVSWPAFPDASSAGFAGKYSPRQIDSIVAQVLTLGARLSSPDYPHSSDVNNEMGYASVFQGRRMMTVPMLFPGWLTGQWVTGMGRAPKMTSVLLKFTTEAATSTDPTDRNSAPDLYVNIWTEWWLPAGYLGGNNVVPLGSQYAGAEFGTGVFGNCVLNQSDEHGSGSASTMPESDFTTPSYWGNQLLTNNQGVDFQGNSQWFSDPDQTSARTYHDPWAWTKGSGGTYPGTYVPDEGTEGIYYGSGEDYYEVHVATSAFDTVPYLESPSQTPEWAAGQLYCSANYYGNEFLKMRPSASGNTLTVGGGLTANVALKDATISDAEVVPLDSIRGSGNDLDGENWSDPAHMQYPHPGISTVRDLVMNAVIPVSTSVPVPPEGDASDPGYVMYVLDKVADPLVASFPGDWWPSTVSDSPPLTTMEYQGVASASTGIYSEYDSGFHAALQDPDSYWVPQADGGLCRTLADMGPQTIIPRVARMPSVGYLNYVRTGIIPDDESLDYFPKQGESASQYQHGTPFRLLSYAPSTDTGNQQTSRSSIAAGTSQPYPDWAMLDLLYVPSLLSSYGSPYGFYDPPASTTWTGYGNPNVLAAYSTGGGSTPGRLNPNGCVIYTTNTATPVPGLTRTIPLQAVLQGLMVNQTLNNASTSPNPGYSGGTAIDPASLSAAIASYISSNGPLKMPAELCNVPEIAALRPAVNATRNDLVRQIVGALTTQSNVFSVWTVGQTIKKVPGHTNYGIFEPGDQVLAQARFHFIVERYLDQGTNPASQDTSTVGPDGVVGTYDDVVNPVNRPYCPKYLYRVVCAEELR